MIRRFLLKTLFWLCDLTFKIDYVNINQDILRRWLFDSYKSDGFREYFKMEDLKILKTLGMPNNEEEKWKLIGRRYQLLSLYDDMRRVAENKKENKPSAIQK